MAGSRQGLNPFRTGRALDESGTAARLIVLEKAKKCRKIMVLLEGIELSTSPLPRECSTTELQQRRG